MESNPKEEKVRGFAGLIDAILNPINDLKKFQDEFSNIDTKILLNAINVDHAALIIIKNSTLTVKSIENKPKEKLNKKVLGWDALLEMDTQTFLAVSMKKISMLSMLKKILTGKIKVKGIRKVLILLKILALLDEERE